MSESGRRRNPFRPDRFRSRSRTGIPSAAGAGTVPAPETTLVEAQPGHRRAGALRLVPRGRGRDGRRRARNRHDRCGPCPDHQPRSCRAQRRRLRRAHGDGRRRSGGGAGGGAAEELEEAELVELAPGRSRPPRPSPCPLPWAVQLPRCRRRTRRGSAAARLRTLVLAVLAVILTAVLGFAAGTLLPRSSRGRGSRARRPPSQRSSDRRANG